MANVLKMTIVEAIHSLRSAGLGARLAARPPLHVEGASRPDLMARRGAAELRPRSIRKTLVNRRGPNGYPKGTSGGRT